MDRQQVEDHEAAAPRGEDGGVVIATRRAAGCVRLARGRKRNALVVEMLQAMAAAYPRFARDPIVYAVAVSSAAEGGVFSAGADLAELADLIKRNPDEACAALRETQSLCWLHECFSKPTVSLIDGAVMGSGVGITLFGTHRVAGADYAFSCPETGIGLVPGNGLSHVLARMPTGVGLYLALTGDAIGRADALALGLVTHCIAATHFAEIVAHLEDADPVDAVLDGLHKDPGPSPLMRLQPLIARCFSAPTVAEITARLEGERGENQDWARAAAEAIRARSPMAARITQRLLREAARLDLRSALQLEYRVLCRLLPTADVGAGLAAVLGHTTPTWARLDAAQADEAVAAFFAEDAEPTLELAPRELVQAARY